MPVASLIAPPFRSAPLLAAVAVLLASINIFGGFLVTRRMLEMFKKKTPAVKKEG